MGKRLFAAMAVLVLVTGCARLADSRFNPVNWFGASEAQPVNTLIPREANFTGAIETSVQIPELTSMNVDRMPGGAILTAEGVTVTQGFWDATLVEVEQGAEGAEPGALVFDFRVERPYRRHPVGAVPTRTVSAGTYLSDVKMRGVTRIIVRGATTQRVVRR
jgi:hypothetical protein